MRLLGAVKAFYERIKSDIAGAEELHQRCLALELAGACWREDQKKVLSLLENGASVPLALALRATTPPIILSLKNEYDVTKEALERILILSEDKEKDIGQAVGLALKEMGKDDLLDLCTLLDVEIMPDTPFHKSETAQKLRAQLSQNTDLPPGISKRLEPS